jgi:hypothetical protein
MGGAEEWEALETGRRWRLEGAGEWEALEIGRRCRMAVAGEWQALEEREAANSGSRPNIDSVTDLFPGAHQIIPRIKARGKYFPFFS